MEFIGLLLAVGVLAIVIVLLLANLGAYFTKISTGTTVFINSGDSRREILPNIDGYKMSKAVDLDGRQWLVPAKKEEERMESLFANSLPGPTRLFQEWLWQWLGIKFISFFWPHVYVHRFNIRSRKSIRERSEIGEKAPLRSRVVDSSLDSGETTPSTEVSSLLFVVPRPVYAEGVELAGDNSKINLLLLPVFRQVIPSVPVYDLKGDFFALLDAAIEAAMVDFFARHRVAVYKSDCPDEKKRGQFAGDFWPQTDEEKAEFAREYGGGVLSECESSPLNYALWIKLPKGEGSPLEHHLRHLNMNSQYYGKLRKAMAGGEENELVAYAKSQLTQAGTGEIDENSNVGKIAPHGIVPRFGFALISFRLVEWEPHENTKDLADALLAKETERHTAEGVREKSFGERDAAMARAEGDSSRFKKPVESLVDLGVTPDVAAQVLATQLRTENIGGKESKVVTYVEGGGRASVMIPTAPQTPTS